MWLITCNRIGIEASNDAADGRAAAAIAATIGSGDNDRDEPPNSAADGVVGDAKANDEWCECAEDGVDGDASS
jgi:hypothetical protein